MLKRSLSPILTAIAMVLILLNYDFSTEIGSRKFWLFIIALIVLIAAIVLVYKSNKNEKQ